MTGSPFHIGEQRVQAALGVRDSIEPWARRVIRNHLPGQHREFYAQLPFIVAAARDNDGRPWATLLTGRPGFARSPDAHTLLLDAIAHPDDALHDALAAGNHIGLLGIELHTRRRNRVNGRVAEIGAAGMRIAVGQAFGNCPQYITERNWRSVDVDPVVVRSQRGIRLDAGMRAWIESADTMFVASGYAGRGENDAFGMDASHRGGAPGFVNVASDTRLVFPDYAGNNHFNTLGNLLMDPRIGLLFVDFDAGSVLQLTGRAIIDWNPADIADYAGAQRLVNVEVDEVVRLDGVLPLRWSRPRGSIRSMRVLRKVYESDDVVSLELVPRDDGTLPDFEAGQHLPIELAAGERQQPVRRTYSLSNSPGTGRYRISVKREPGGLVSNLLHDAVEEGAIINVGTPAGDFVLACSRRPVVLVGAGIGVTPLVSMLHQLAAQKDDRRVIFVHGVRNGAHHPLAAEIRNVARTNENVRIHVAYSQPRKEDRQGIDYDYRGRVTAALLWNLVPGIDADYYLCGPPTFLADLEDSLIARGTGPERIHAETFAGSQSAQTQGLRGDLR